ncbi:MAG: alpha-hydroxy-acid oxidizing protein [Acidobacteria bacterium]|nr:MAG: alpha-hydroxy-acid oxidizing protein [Acidobacteriota bacterium]PYY01103.1 MAG: alpha-hydroxy-acid oxidizing protein [Acidobacteriota bacterium]PYY24648.1 MAG: alpha-hydroxy-acid oxidizing protein [Acidobacteriota bacterium]
MSRLSSPRIININDLRRVAQRRLPRVVFDYLEGGAENEITLQDNVHAFQQVTFRPRQAVHVEAVDLRTCVLEQQLSMPVILAPVGYSRLMHPDGEIAAARAAHEAGTAFVLSTISGHKLEALRAASDGLLWYQLYLLGGREAAESTIERARRAGFSVLVITVDTPVAGNRERDPRNGMRELLSGTLLEKIRFAPQILKHPRWLISFLLDGCVPKLENVVVPGKGPLAMTDVAAALSSSIVQWDDLAWIRRCWLGPIVVKGILTAEDARRAVDHGAAAIVVSNHGGRQLDGVPASLRALPEIYAAVGKETEILMDGGIRRGSDIVKALCLGARAVLIGRAYAYGLAAYGKVGVERALEILRDDLRRTLTLLGCSSADQLNPSFVNLSRDFIPSLGSHSNP